MKNLLCGLSLLLFSLSLGAQNRLEGNYILTSFGASFDQFNDAYVSPVNYAGYSGLFGLGWHTYTGPWMNNLDVLGHAGWQSPQLQANQGSRTLGLGFRGHYSLRYRFWKSNTHQIFAGVYSQNAFILREHSNYSNSAQSFSGFFGYGPSLAYTFSNSSKIFKKDWHWSWQSEVNIPLGTYLLRPNFIRQYSAGEIGDRGHHFLNGTWQIDFRHSLIWHLRTGNQIRLVYAWEYFQTDRFNALYNGGHQVQLQLFFKL